MQLMVARFHVPLMTSYVDEIDVFDMIVQLTEKIDHYRRLNFDLISDKLSATVLGQLSFADGMRIHSYSEVASFEACHSERSVFRRRSQQLSVFGFSRNESIQQYKSQTASSAARAIYEHVEYERHTYAGRYFVD